MFVIDAKISNLVNVLPLDNPLDALGKNPCIPLCLAFSLSYHQCLSSQCMPLRVKNNLKSVKQQISYYDFEWWIDIRKEASMSEVVKQC
jgi:hypothetical protein